MMEGRVAHMLQRLSFYLLIGLGLLFVQLAQAESILGGLVDQEDDFLPPDQAFQLVVNMKDAYTLKSSFKVAPGHYLYKNRIQLTSEDAQLSPLALPTGEMKNDPNFGTQEVYHNDFIATASVTPKDLNQEQITIQAKYQGCSEKGLCYAPIRKTFTLPVVSTESTHAGNVIATNINTSPASPFNTSKDSTALLATGNLLWIVAGFFGAGLLLSLTPCVLPMIPILSSIIVGSQKNEKSSHSPFGLSVAYVLGMALSYTLAGVAAGLSGSLISQSLQNSWVLGITAGVFVLLALSMFGVYDLKLPDKLESRMLATSQRLKGGEYIGVFIMGALSALIVSPCVAAPLAGALLYIGQTHNVVLGGLGLFALAMGMGVPLLMLGASAGKMIPKAGEWMNVVKNLFGLVMLGMAVWIVAPLIDETLVLAITAVLVTLASVYVWQLSKTVTHQGVQTVSATVGVLGIGYAGALLLAALSGGQSLLQPLKHWQVNISHTALQTKQLAFEPVASIKELDTRIHQAEGQPVMLDFYADWCVACKEMEHETFSDPAIQALLDKSLLLQADVTENTAEHQALLKQFGLYGPPGILFFDQSGHLINQVTTIGFKNPTDFAEVIQHRNECLQHTAQC